MECIWTGKRWWRDREKGPGKKWVKSVDYGWWEHVHEELHRRVTMHKEVTCMWSRNGLIPLSEMLGLASIYWLPRGINQVNQWWPACKRKL